MQGHQFIALFLSVAVVAGCRSERHMTAPVPLSSQETTVEGTPVGDDRTAMEAAIDAGGSATARSSVDDTGTPREAPALNPNAPDNYVVKRGDTLWGIAKVFLRDPWFWPEIWQVNPQVQNPHLIYPGDTLRLVYVDGQPRVVLQRGEMSLQQGGLARVIPRVRSQPLEAAVTTIPYETVAAFMSKPTVIAKEQIKSAPYVMASRDLHVAMASGDTLYARGFSAPIEVGTHYNVVRIGDPLRDPDDNRVVGYDGIFTGAGRLTRVGDPATIVMTESTRETVAGDKLFVGGVDVPLDFIPSPPRIKVDGRIMAVSDGVTIIGQYQVVVINRGVRDGLAPGNVLGIYDDGPVVHDTGNKNILYSMTLLGTKKVKLPSERTGTFMVFKTFDSMSYGLVMEATNIIRVADHVENP